MAEVVECVTSNAQSCPFCRVGFAVRLPAHHIVTDLLAKWLIAARTGWC